MKNLLNLIRKQRGKPKNYCYTQSLKSRDTLRKRSKISEKPPIFIRKLQKKPEKP